MTPKEFAAAFAQAAGISPEEQAVLDAGSSHHFRCRCETCLQWWKLMGPENAEQIGMPDYVPEYGPFTPEEVERGLPT